MWNFEQVITLPFFFPFWCLKLYGIQSTSVGPSSISKDSSASHTPSSQLVNSFHSSSDSKSESIVSLMVAFFYHFSIHFLFHFSEKWKEKWEHKWEQKWIFREKWLSCSFLGDDPFFSSFLIFIFLCAFKLWLSKHMAQIHVRSLSSSPSFL